MDFLAKLRVDGVDVDNLDKQLFLPWKAFEATVDLLVSLAGKRRKGNAQGGGKISSKDVPFDSVEGHVTSVVYDL